MRNYIKDIRLKRGLSQQDLAEALRIGVPQVSRWETGKVDIPMSRLIHLSALLQVPLHELVHEDLVTDAARVDGPPPPNARAVPMEGASLDRMQEDLPVYGTALGAPRVIDGDAVEQTMLNSGEVIQYVKRPAILNGRADAYGLYIQGSSMAPVHQEGDMILAETKRPARIGDDAVVYLRPKNEDDDDGSRARSALVKRLVRRTGSYVELEQFSPQITFRIPVEEVLRIDRVLRLVDLLG